MAGLPLTVNPVRQAARTAGGQGMDNKQTEGRIRYVEVLLPVKLAQPLTYSLPPQMEDLPVGRRVTVPLGRIRHTGVVRRLVDGPPEGMEPARIRPVEECPPMPDIPPESLDFWDDLARYYMCTPGEVFKAAYPREQVKQAMVKSRPAMKEAPEAPRPLPPLTPAQLRAANEIRESFRAGFPALLNGVTGSGKTEVYLHLAAEVLGNGQSVLFLVPEIALSRQLQERVAAFFGPVLTLFHSRLTPARKKAALECFHAPGHPARLVLGTRSSLFLPIRNLGLIVVDEEHDASYKQDDPAPRYNGRDAALLLAMRQGIPVLMGSATPSCESLYNVVAGKFRLIDLPGKYHGEAEPRVEIIDMREVRRLRNARGSFSMQLVNAIAAETQAGNQVMVFRSRRAYAGMLQCTACGAIPPCPRCHVALSYHKSNQSMQCHLCGSPSTASAPSADRALSSPWAPGRNGWKRS